MVTTTGAVCTAPRPQIPIFPAMKTTPSVYVIDDDAAVCESLIALIQQRGVTAESFGSAEAFLQSHDALETGCLVTDMRMPGMSGLELLAELKARNSTLPVILLTAYGDIPLAVKAMQAGAETFLEKPCSDAELWHSIESALHRDQAQQERQRVQADIKSRFSALSPEEAEVYRRLYFGQQNKQICKAMDIGLRTVELRRSNLSKKMQAQTLQELVRMAISASLFAEQDRPQDTLP